MSGHFSFFQNGALKPFLSKVCLLLASFILTSPTAPAQDAPQKILGFQPTDDRKIADWTQISNYFQKLDAQSERVKVENFGKTTLGKPMIAAFISAPENLKKLNDLQAIQQKLSDPRLVKSETERAALIRDGKTFVSISCSIHANEIVASQMSMLLAHRLTTANDETTRQILDNTVLILIPSSNPDGVDIVADWYRKTLGTKSEGTIPPELYHHYAGHDNNRDWFMLNLAETRAITNLYWRQWFPQVVYDVHQMGQNGARFIIPPFFDPANPNIDPLTIRQTGLFGYKMATDLEAAGIKGTATNAVFDMWWHGGFRSAPYYHNSVGILSEAASANLMSPVTISRETLEKGGRARGVANPLQPAVSYPSAWQGGTWSPRDIAEIELVASRAVLSLAAKNRAELLENFYNLNKKALDGANYPNQPIAYVVSSAQPNKQNTARMLEILLAQGVEIRQTAQEIEFIGEHSAAAKLPKGSFVIFTAQPQRPNVQALFERQIYPDRRAANGEAEVPYDVAGWTLPLQMGVESFAVRSLADDKAANFLTIKNASKIRQSLGLAADSDSFAKLPNPLKTAPRIALYKGSISSMDEGWTRLVFDNFQIPFVSMTDKMMKTNDLRADFDVVVLPSESESEIVRGLSKEKYPDEFAEGIGENGIENLKKFVESGGKLVCFDQSCGLVIKHFGLPLRNALQNIKRSEFYSPGSIMKLEVESSHNLAKGLPSQTAAYFINSSAFEISDAAVGGQIRTAARYAEKDVLMSGWLLGEKNLQGKIALAETDYGKGKIVLFAFRPQHRGQTWATFPFLFNALEK